LVPQEGRLMARKHAFEGEETKIDVLSDSLKDRWGNASTEELGICSNCRYLFIQKRSLGDELYWCTYCQNNGEKIPIMQPSKIDPIVECSGFSRKGEMDIWDMRNIAWRVDVKRKKRKIGIQQKEEDEDYTVEIIPPQGG